jgi:alkylation response protein AidB-like acyl-CoA dehydrogenase
MHFELTAKTEAGGRLVALAETLAEDFATRAGKHDREGSYPFESFEALRSARYFAAPIPEQHGGLGVASTHDVLVASSRLARGDASIAIGVNMHLTAVLNVVRRFEMAVAAGNDRRAAAFARSMEQVAHDGVVMAAAISEPAQDLTRPATTATRTESGWRVNGRKIFCTMSPAASVLYTAVTFVDEDGSERYGYALIPTDAPGVIIHDDWDALGMRASGSNSVTLNEVELPAAALRGGFPVGDPVPYMERNLTAGLFHASASLGIAEASHRVATRSIVERGRGLDGSRIRMLAAENAMDLSACRAVFGRAAALIDDHYAANPASDGTDEDLTALFAEAQGAKTFINEAAGRIVDRALALSGGGGYLNGSPLARAYRDVRAGAFMNPLGADRAYELVGRTALGLEPALS